MGRREDLLKEHTKWTIKYVKAHERVVALLPPMEKLQPGKEPPMWIPTPESVAEFESAKKEEETALAKLWEIVDELGKLSQAGG